jgi:hypothetical protein
MKKQLVILALSLTAFAAPAQAGSAVANVVQVTSYGNNSSSISQSARNTAVANVAQATIVGNNRSSISQHARNMAAGVAQGTVAGNNVSHISQSSFPFGHHRHR